MVPGEVVSRIRAYTGKAVKFYVWLLAQPGPELLLARTRVNEAMGWVHDSTFRRIIHELSIGHQELDDIAPPLIEIIEWRNGRGARWKIRVLRPGMGD